MVLIWENDYSASPIINIDLTFFEKQKNGMYRRYMEEHRQRCYPIEMVKELVEKTGFVLKQLKADLFDSPLDPSHDERMYFVTYKIP